MWPDSSETQELLELARGGDAAARNRLLERHREAVRRMIALRIDPVLERRMDASDIVQDVLIEADRRLNEYLESTKMPFHAWLRHMARDRLIDAHRRHRGAARRSMDREMALPAADLSNQSAFDLANLLADRQMTPAAAATHHELGGCAGSGPVFVFSGRRPSAGMGGWRDLCEQRILEPSIMRWRAAMRDRRSFGTNVTTAVSLTGSRRPSTSVASKCLASC